MSRQVIGRATENFGVGRNKRLSDFRGKVVVLNFWASYCGSCVEELPDLNRLQERIRSRGSVILGVSVDPDCARYEDCLTKYPVRFQTSCEPTRKSLARLRNRNDTGNIRHRPGRVYRQKVRGSQRWDSPEITKYFDATLSQNQLSRKIPTTKKLFHREKTRQGRMMAGEESATSTGCLESFPCRPRTSALSSV